MNTSPDSTAGEKAAEKPPLNLGPLIPLGMFFAVMTGALVYTSVGNSARFEDDRLTGSADLVREQMDGSPTDQITRVVMPTRGAAQLAWVEYDADDWSMCVSVGDGRPDESRFLIFGEAGDYAIQDGICPDDRTLDTPTEAS